MNLNRKMWLMFLSVFLVAFIVRFWNLTKFPVHLTMDEASIGYNAYSILETGKDEWGVPFPLAFKSVGDYKPPVNIYLTVPSVAIFGLSEFAVRAPVALFGVLTCVALFYLIILLGFSKTSAFLAGIWLGINPWHVHFSRAGFEAITALFFLVSGTVFLLKWIENKKQLNLIMSGVTFSLSVWTYHSERLFVPIWVGVLFFLVKDKISIRSKLTKKQLTRFVLVVLIFAIPFIYLSFFTPAIRERAASTSILRDVSLTRNLHNGNYANLTDAVFDNDKYLIFRHWAGKYLNYYDLRFWFWKGMQFTPDGYPDLGLLYVIDIPIFLFGAYALSRSKNKFLKRLTLMWFFLGPLPASLAVNEQHPLRALTWLPFFGIVIASGFDYLIKNIQRWRKMLFCVYVVALSLNVVYFADIYLHHFPFFFAQYWQYGYKDAAIYACENKDNYDRIFISDTFGIDGPLNTGIPGMYYLFYCKVKPGEKVNKIEIRRPSLEFVEHAQSNALYIAAPWDFPLDEISENRIVNTSYYPSGEAAFLYVKSE